jgi:hypothetical protein
MQETFMTEIRGEVTEIRRDIKDLNLRITCLEVQTSKEGATQNYHRVGRHRDRFQQRRFSADYAPQHSAEKEVELSIRRRLIRSAAQVRPWSVTRTMMS